jgi:hypothetical protein
MKKTGRVLGLAALLGLLILTGCAAVGKAPVEKDLEAKKLAPPEGKALVYIVRPSSMGMAIKMEVTCDGKYLGATGGGRFIYAILDPGSHVFVSKAENKSELPIVLEANKTYYLEQKIKMGIIKARNNLERIEDAEGKDKLNRSSLSADLQLQ